MRRFIMLSESRSCKYCNIVLESIPGCCISTVLIPDCNVYHHYVAVRHFIYNERDDDTYDRGTVGVPLCELEKLRSPDDPPSVDRTSDNLVKISHDNTGRILGDILEDWEKLGDEEMLVSGDISTS